MEIENLLILSTREKLREWLLENHNKEKCCWVIVSMKPKQGVLLYLDAVEEGLCFGWIDGIKKSISENQTAQRFSPRTPKSSWTELNKERVRRLEQIGLMTDAGRRVLPEMNPEAFLIDSYIIQRLKEDQIVYQNFIGFPELYRRIRIDSIQRERKDNESYMRRLEKLIHYTRENKMYGDWNDGGKL